MGSITNKYLPDEVLSSSYLYRGRIVNVRQDRVLTAGGKKGFREIVEHPGAVAVLAIDEEERILLVRQYRRPAGEYLLEIPAGKIEPGEEPLQCAQRELPEETGMQAGHWKELTCFYPSPGFCDEKIYIYKAEALLPVKAETSDPEEELSCTAVFLKDAWQMVTRGEIVDGKTIIAIQYALIEDKR